MKGLRTRNELEREIARLRRQVASLEEKLRDLQRGSFRDVAASASDWVWETDAEGRYVFSSGAVERILGYTPAEIGGRYFYEFFHPEDRERLKSASLKVFEEKRIFLSFRNRNVHKDGHPVILETTGFPILGPEGQLLGYRGADRDITTWVQAEERLRESEERFRAVFETAQDSIFIKDRTLKYIQVNPTMERLFGLPASKLIGLTDEDLFGEEAGAHIKEVDSRVLGGEIVEEEHTKPVKGTPKTFHIIKVPVRDSSGEIIGLCGIARDITKQVKAKQALRQANEELQRVLDTMGEGLVVMDDRHRMISLNRKACELFQYAPDEILGKHYSFWCHPDFLGELKKELKEREAGKISTYEGRFVRKDGTPFYALVTATPIMDAQGNYQGSVGCLRDITEEKRVAEEIQRLHEFNEKLIQVAGAWIDVLDVEGKVVLWNEEAERISGYSREEVIGHDKVWEWLYPDPAYCAEVLRRRGQWLLMDTDFRTVETTIRSKAGEERTISWYWRGLFDGEGRITGSVVVGHDVTEQRWNERQLHEYAKQVERLNREKSRFLSTASHELRTPLTAIQGFADLLARDEDLRAEQREMVKRIRAQAERLEDLLVDLLNVSRIESGKARLTPRVVDLGAILRRVIHVLMPQLEEKGHTLAWDHNHLSTRVYADPDAVEQILMNILSNAIAYTPSGGRIAIDLHNMDGSVRIDVSDNGIGIPLPEQRWIFDEFYRTVGARRVKGDGTGLGLSIVKQLVDDSGGSVWMRSAGEGKGSTFSFTLPKASSVGDSD